MQAKLTGRTRAAIRGRGTPTARSSANSRSDAIVAEYTRTLEGWVRRYPEQYFWQHRRWRHQPADTPPHLREP